MSQTLPVFPLPLCLFRQELLPLHIFEPRYVRMLRVCSEEGSDFVIRPVVKGMPRRIGTLARFEKVVTRYSGGRSDVLVRGIATVNISETIPALLPDHADLVICSLCDFDDDEDKELTLRTDDLLREVLQLMDPVSPYRFRPAARIHEFIHKIGLSPEQEYELLQMEDYAGQQQWVVNWLKGLFEHLSAAARMKQAIAMNGHFREIKSAE